MCMKLTLRRQHIFPRLVFFSFLFLIQLKQRPHPLLRHIWHVPHFFPSRSNNSVKKDRPGSTGFWGAVDVLLLSVFKSKSWEMVLEAFGTKVGDVLISLSSLVTTDPELRWKLKAFLLGELPLSDDSSLLAAAMNFFLLFRGFGGSRPKWRLK